VGSRISKLTTLERFVAPSFAGLVAAAFFFAASLTPSLLPRHFSVQGLLSGFALSLGYGVGVLIEKLWTFLEFPQLAPRTQNTAQSVAGAMAAIVAIVFLARAAVWQNSIRALMEMPPVTTAYPWRVAMIALIVGVLLILAARALRTCWLYVHRRVNRLVPRRVSYVLTSLVVLSLVILIANHALARMALYAADAVFLQIDRAVDEAIDAPQDRLACGSAESLVEWDSIGLQGKNFITRGPTQTDIGEFWGREAATPLRIYVGVRTKETPAERAKLAMAELKRVGAFDRSLLVVATPTGTGWLDPGAVDTLEYLHNGDTAIVSTQYSYLPSWITILVDPNRSRDAARALFDEVYGHWRTLPKDGRPKLYVHGLSLGALGSEDSADLFTVFEDPIHGGVWSGPPFPSAVWSRITQSRNPDSPVWLPTSRDASMVRFMGRENLDDSGARWGPMRFVYIQHASDPMTFFSPDLFYRQPGWLASERGPDVSPYLRWYPAVTFLQTAFDLPMSTSVPSGYGHNFDAASYIDAWMAVTDPDGVDADSVARLKRLFAEQARESAASEPQSP
jgi:uncharacterized membrane protein